MKKLLLFSSFTILILILLAVTKPDEVHFKNWIKQELKTEKEDDLVTKFISTVTKVQADFNVKYEDKIIFSTAETTVLGEAVSFIGIFGFWIPV